VTSCLAVVAKRMSAKNVLVKRIDIITVNKVKKGLSRTL
jgi:hypothetical protein